jgi:thioredoxin reductase
VLERGPQAGHTLAAWSHVRVFSPWWLNIDRAAQSLLEETGWRSPDDEALPTGGELVRDYLAPLARHPKLAPHLRFGAEVVAVTRRGFNKVTNAGRNEAPFVVRYRDAAGLEEQIEARAVIDASGTWFAPNPLGVDGIAVPGERGNADRIAYGIPDVLTRERDRYAGARVLVVGSGHSAINVVLDLLKLQEGAPETRVVWALRRNRLEKLLGGGLNDQLPARGALGLAAKSAIDAGRLRVLAPFAARRVDRAGNALRVQGRVNGHDFDGNFDRIVVATGFRPDLSMLREIRVELDPAVEAPPALAPLIDPNLHSCGTVPPHGVVELTQPEKDFYIVGAKSYGRAPTFLMATGYEQVRSIVAELAGDHEAARDVQLVLPETGVCNSSAITGEEDGASCCGGPAIADDSACCVADEVAKAETGTGCGCSAAPTPVSVKPATKNGCGASAR